MVTLLEFVSVHEYAQPDCDPEEVTLNEQGEPALTQPVVTIVGSGALRTSVVEAVLRYDEQAPLTAEAAAVTLRRTFRPSVLKTLRSSEYAGIEPSVAEPVLVLV